MSQAGVPRVFVAIVAVVAVALLAACAQKPDADRFNTFVPSVDVITVAFSCGAVDSIAMTAPNGDPAWIVGRKQKDPISWVVPANVTINSITGLPLDTAGSQGGTPGTPYKSKVKENAERKTYHYAIELTCRPAAGPPDTHLIIDPEFIVHP